MKKAKPMFLNLEKRNYINKNMLEIFDNSNVLQTDNSFKNKINAAASKNYILMIIIRNQKRLYIYFFRYWSEIIWDW